MNGRNWRAVLLMENMDGWRWGTHLWAGGGGWRLAPFLGTHTPLYITTSDMLHSSPILRGIGGGEENDWCVRRLPVASRWRPDRISGRMAGSGGMAKKSASRKKAGWLRIVMGMA